MSYISDHPELRELIANHRETLNKSVRERLHSGAKFDPSDFLLQLDQGIGPVLSEVAKRFPERAGIALIGLCEVVLDLLAAGQLRSSSITATSPLMSSLWNRLMPKLAVPIAIDSKRVAASLSNALIQIAQESPMVAVRWLRNLMEVADELRTVDSALHAGRFLAWTSGLAQYRMSVLGYAATMPAELVQLCLSGSGQATGGSGSVWIERLKKDPWAGGVDSGDARQWKKVGRVGAFRGFGGVLLAPPLVWCDEAGLLASDGQRIWKIHADRFGAIMTRFDGIRVEDRPWKNAKMPSRGKWTSSIPELEKANSIANEGTTLVWTEPTSFHVFIGANIQPIDTIAIAGG